MAFVSVWEADRAHIEALDLRHITDMAYISAADETIVELRTRIEALERVDQDALLPDGWENNSPLWVAGWNAALRAVAAAIRRAALAAKDK